ncbi:MAG: isoprenyl transferase [Spirochaetota bacterium]
MIIDGIELDETRIPRHVALIMDGNGRWAKLHGKRHTEGHRAGSERVLEIVDAAGHAGIGTITLYAFSTENWKRPKQEVEFLMMLLDEFFRTKIREAIDKGVRIRQIGDMKGLPERTQKTVRDAEERSKDNTKLTVNVALNYGSRDEIVRAVRSIAEKAAAGTLAPNAITEETISLHLDTHRDPDPDLLIRTSGEWRLSNFLLYQIAYAELWVTETLWPDFTGREFISAVADYQKRERRFGARTE